MNVSEVMSSDVAIVNVSTTVADAAQEMESSKTGCLAVTDGESVVGIITERDMVLGCLIDGHVSWKCHVYRHMTILEEAAHPSMDVGDALYRMMELEVSCLPVAENGRVLGMLYSEDVSRAIEEDNEPQPALVESSLVG